MEIVKKNLISIICGVVALAALVVGLLVVPGWAADLKTKLDASKSAHDKLDDLLEKERLLPVVNPDNPASEKLPQFPSEAAIKQGEQLTKKVEEESKAILKAAVDMNVHTLSPPLEPGTLPSPTQTQAFAFRNWYQGVMPLPVQPGGAPMQGQPGQLPPVMRTKFAKDLSAGLPPSPEDIRVKQMEEEKRIREKETIMVGGQPANQAQVDAKIKDRTSKLPTEIRDKIANESKIYLALDTFEVYPQIGMSVAAPNPIDMYFAQLGFWVQQDIVNAIAEVNASSKSVKESPVKRLIRIRSKGTNGVPNFITNVDGTANSDGDAALPKVPMVSPTQRVSNGLYDVFHVTVEADVDANRLQDFLRGLSLKRFITPYSVDVRARDNAQALAEGHMYGSNPVVNVTAQCEVLYLRRWNAPLMPVALRTRLGIVDAAPTADGQAPAQPAAAPLPPGI